MSLLVYLKGNFRLAVLVASAVIAFLVGFVVVPAETALTVMTYGGYWMMLGLSVVFAVCLWRIWQVDRPRVELKALRPGWPALVIAVSWIGLLVHETFGFKILMDEAMLAGTSMSMHYDKLAYVPMRGHNIIGAFELLGGQLDKRPLFFPFLVSLLHDFSGYRPENAFVLNAGLTLLLLVLVYFFGRAVGGRPAGAIGVLLLGGLPLLSQNATGGGFEVLNLVMVVATMLLAIRYAKRHDGPSLDALVVGTVLLALTRYESVLFVVPIALLILWVWWQDRAMRLDWIGALAPLYLIPYALHHQVFSLRESSWEMASQPGYEVPFSVNYITDNVGHALAFFFDTTGAQSNSLTLGVVALLALPLAIFWGLGRLRQAAEIPAREVAILAVFLGGAAHTLLMMCYFWGRFDDPVIRRLSLPLNLFLVLMIVVVASDLPGQIRKWWILAGLTVFGTFAYSFPAMARHDYSLDYYVGRETAWRREFIAANPEKDYLVIDTNAIEWIIHEVSSTPVTRARDEPEILRFNLKNHVFSAIYVFQRYTVDAVTGAVELPEEYALGERFKLETVWQRQFTPFTVSRISRVVSIDEPVEGSVEVPQGSAAAAESAPRSPEDWEKVRQAYLENFVKQLP